MPILETIGLLAFGFFVGTYGTLIGIGGGPLHVPFLMIFYQLLTPVDIIATSLFAILFNVLAGSFFYYRQGKIDLISGTKFGLAAIPGAFLGTFITHYFTLRFLEVLFGLLLLGLGVYVLFSALKGVAARAEHGYAEDLDEEERPRWRKTLSGINTDTVKLTKRVIRDSHGKKYVYWFNERLGLLISAIVGFVGPLIGIGGGVFHVPLLTEVLKFPPRIATATVHYVLLITVFFALIPYVHLGAVHYEIAIPIGIGSVFGARVGAMLSQKISSSLLFKLLSFVMIFLSLRLLFFP